jgi:hypothetical protein
VPEICGARGRTLGRSSSRNSCLRRATHADGLGVRINVIAQAATMRMRITNVVADSPTRAWIEGVSTSRGTSSARTEAVQKDELATLQSFCTARSEGLTFRFATGSLVSVCSAMARHSNGNRPSRYALATRLTRAAVHASVAKQTKHASVQSSSCEGKLAHITSTYAN